MTTEVHDIILGVLALLTASIPLFMKFYKPKAKLLPLKQHPFFTTIDYWITQTAPKIEIDNALKRRCIRVFIIIKLKTFHTALLREVDKLSQDESYDMCSIPALFIEWVEEYEKEARTAGIPEVFIRKFSEWHALHVDATFNACKNICGSTIFHPTPHDKMAGTLDLMLNAFHLTMLDAEITLNSLNGELTSALEKDFANKVGLWRE